MAPFLQAFSDNAVMRAMVVVLFSSLFHSVSGVNLNQSPNEASIDASLADAGGPAFSPFIQTYLAGQTASYGTNNAANISSYCNSTLGQIMPRHGSNVKINVLYYTDLTQNASLQANIVQNVFTAFVTGFASSNWSTTFKKYYDPCDSNHTTIQSMSIGSQLNYDCNSYKGPLTNVSTIGGGACKVVESFDIALILSDAIANRSFAVQNGVPSSQDVFLFVIAPTIYQQQPNGYAMGTDYCSYHSYNTYQANLTSPIQYLYFSVVQIPPDGSNCIAVSSTVNSESVDSFLVFAIHEIIETVTSPLPTGSINITYALWQDPNQLEVMDKCASGIANLQYLPNQTYYNSYFNGYYFVLPTVYDPVLQNCVFVVDKAPVAPIAPPTLSSFHPNCTAGGNRAIFYPPVQWVPYGCFNSSASIGTVFMEATPVSGNSSGWTAAQCNLQCTQLGYPAAAMTQNGTIASQTCMCGNGIHEIYWPTLTSYCTASNNQSWAMTYVMNMASNINSNGLNKIKGTSTMLFIHSILGLYEYIGEFVSILYTLPVPSLANEYANFVVNQKGVSITSNWGVTLATIYNNTAGNDNFCFAVQTDGSLALYGAQQGKLWTNGVYLP